MVGLMVLQTQPFQKQTPHLSSDYLVTSSQDQSHPPYLIITGNLEIRNIWIVFFSSYLYLITIFLKSAFTMYLSYVTLLFILSPRYCSSDLLVWSFHYGMGLLISFLVPNTCWNGRHQMWSRKSLEQSNIKLSILVLICILKIFCCLSLKRWSLIK